MKGMFLLGVCLLALGVSPVMAQAVGPDIVVVRVVDVIGVGGNNVRFAVSRGEGKTVESSYDSAFKGKALVTATEGYHKVIYELYREGYALQSTMTGVGGYVSTLVFVKAKASKP